MPGEFTERCPSCRTGWKKPGFATCYNCSTGQNRTGKCIKCGAGISGRYKHCAPCHRAYDSEIPPPTKILGDF